MLTWASLISESCRSPWPAAALDCLRSNPMCKIWVDAVCINQDDVDERNAQVMRIREIYSQSFAVTIWLGEDEMSNMDLNSWVENSFDNLRRCGTILEAHGRRTLEAALGIDVRAWESDHNYDELEHFPFSSDVLYFDNEWWADSDDDEEFAPPHFRDLVALALRRLVQNPYWTRLWIIQERRPHPPAPLSLLSVSLLPSSYHPRKEGVSPASCSHEMNVGQTHCQEAEVLDCRMHARLHQGSVH